MVIPSDVTVSWDGSQPLGTPLLGRVESQENVVYQKMWMEWYYSKYLKTSFCAVNNLWGIECYEYWCHADCTPPCVNGTCNMTVGECGCDDGYIGDVCNTCEEKCNWRLLWRLLWVLQGLSITFSLSHWKLWSRVCTELHLPAWIWVFPM